MKIYIKNREDFIKLLIKNGITQSDLAIMAGVSRPHINTTINGSPVGAKVAKKICESLNKDFDEIFLIKKLTKVS